MGLLSWQGRGARPPPPPSHPSSRAGGSSHSVIPPAAPRTGQGFPCALLALQCERGWPHLLPPPHKHLPLPPSPPSPFICASSPFISAFHLPPEHLLLVVVATPQSAPSCCRGTQSILGCPSPISGPMQLLPWPCPLGRPLLCSGAALCWVWGPPSPNQGGVGRTRGVGGALAIGILCACLGPAAAPWP